MTRKKFSPEFKAEAVRAVIESSRTVAEVARDHGIGSETLRNWVNAYRRDHPDELPEISEPERAELARLRKEVRELKAEREFLGKAAAFFAKEFRCPRSTRSSTAKKATTRSGACVGGRGCRGPATTSGSTGRSR